MTKYNCGFLRLIFGVTQIYLFFGHKLKKNQLQGEKYKHLGRNVPHELLGLSDPGGAGGPSARLDLQALRSQLVMSKNLPDH